MNATKMSITREMFAKQAADRDVLIFALIEAYQLADHALRVEGGRSFHRALLDIRLATKTAIGEVAPGADLKWESDNADARTQARKSTHDQG